MGSDKRIVRNGHICPTKKQDVIIDAFARLKRRHKGIALRVVGDVKDARYLEQLRVQAHGHAVQFITDTFDFSPHFEWADLRPVATRELPTADEAANHRASPAMADTNNARFHPIKTTYTGVLGFAYKINSALWWPKIQIHHRKRSTLTRDQPILPCFIPFQTIMTS